MHVWCVVELVESIEHALRDWSLARAMWFRSLGLRVEQVRDLSLVHWISCLARQLPTSGFELCMVLLWAIWKQRNEMTLDWMFGSACRKWF